MQKEPYDNQEFNDQKHEIKKPFIKDTIDETLLGKKRGTVELPVQSDQIVAPSLVTLFNYTFIDSDVKIPGKTYENDMKYRFEICKNSFSRNDDFRIEVTIVNNNPNNYLQIDNSWQSLIKRVAIVHNSEILEEINDYDEIANLRSDISIKDFKIMNKSYVDAIDNFTSSTIINPLYKSTQEYLIPPEKLGNDTIFNPEKPPIINDRIIITDGKIDYTPKNVITIQFRLLSDIFGVFSKNEFTPLFLFNKSLYIEIEFNPYAFFVPVFDTSVQDLIRYYIDNPRVAINKMVNKELKALQNIPQYYVERYFDILDYLFQEKDNCLYRALSILYWGEPKAIDMKNIIFNEHNIKQLKNKKNEISIIFDVFFRHFCYVENIEPIDHGSIDNKYTNVIKSHETDTTNTIDKFYRFDPNSDLVKLGIISQVTLLRRYVNPELIFDDYIKFMAGTTWGGIVEIYLASYILKMNLYVINTSGEIYITSEKTIPEQTANIKFLLFDDNKAHYSALSLKKSLSNKETAEIIAILNSKVTDERVGDAQSVFEALKKMGVKYKDFNGVNLKDFKDLIILNIAKLSQFVKETPDNIKRGDIDEILLERIGNAKNIINGVLNDLDKQNMNNKKQTMGRWNFKKLLGILAMGFFGHNIKTGISSNPLNNPYKLNFNEPKMFYEEDILKNIKSQPCINPALQEYTDINLLWDKSYALKNYLKDNEITHEDVLNSDQILFNDTIKNEFEFIDDGEIKQLASCTLKYFRDGISKFTPTVLLDGLWVDGLTKNQNKLFENFHSGASFYDILKNILKDEKNNLQFFNTTFKSSNMEKIEYIQDLENAFINEIKTDLINKNNNNKHYEILLLKNIDNRNNYEFYSIDGRRIEMVNDNTFILNYETIELGEYITVKLLLASPIVVKVERVLSVNDDKESFTIYFCVKDDEKNIKNEFKENIDFYKQIDKEYLSFFNKFKVYETSVRNAKAKIQNTESDFDNKDKILGRLNKIKDDNINEIKNIEILIVKWKSYIGMNPDFEKYIKNLEAVIKKNEDRKATIEKQNDIIQKEIDEINKKYKEYIESPEAKHKQDELNRKSEILDNTVRDESLKSLNIRIDSIVNTSISLAEDLVNNINDNQELLKNYSNEINQLSIKFKQSPNLNDFNDIFEMYKSICIIHRLTEIFPSKKNNIKTTNMGNGVGTLMGNLWGNLAGYNQIHTVWHQPQNPNFGNAGFADFEFGGPNISPQAGFAQAMGIWDKLIISLIIGLLSNNRFSRNLITKVGGTLMRILTNLFKGKQPTKAEFENLFIIFKERAGINREIILDVITEDNKMSTIEAYYLVYVNAALAVKHVIKYEDKELNLSEKFIYANDFNEKDEQCESNESNASWFNRIFSWFKK